MPAHTQNEPPPTTPRTTEALLAPLKHEPLPKPSSIRLLEILPSPESEIWCSLTTVDLDDAPVFDALSYTWGNPITVHEKRDQSDPLEAFKEFEKSPEYHIPGQLVQFDLDAWQYRVQHPFIPYEKVEWNAERKHLIQCNGSAYLVTENLIHALRSLRRWRFGNVVCPESFAAITGHPMSRHLWIDMICINQENVDERNLQIRIMGRIFQSARAVIGWLGPEANQSRHANAALNQFLKMLLKGTLERPILTPKVCALFCVEGITEMDVYAIFALFQRLWFRRAWVVQEAVLARKLVLSYGYVLLPWEFIEVIVEILQGHNLYGSLAEFGVALMKGGPSNKGSRQHLKAGAWMVGSRPEQQEWDEKLQVDPVTCRNFVSGVRTLRQFFGREPLYLPPRGPQLDTPKSPPGDTKPRVWQDEEEPTTIPSSSGRESLDAQSGWHENLLYLFRSCSASDPRDKIFSLYGILEQSGSRIPDIPWDYRIGVQDLYTAMVSSIIRATNRLDILAQVQDPSWTKVSGLPSWIPDFSVDFRAVLFDDPIKPLFSASGLQSLYDPISKLVPSLQVEGFLVDNIICVAPVKGCYFVRTAMVVSGLPSRYHPGRPCSKYAPTRAEAYWRTLLADAIAGVHPAPPEWGFDFSDWIAEEMLRANGQQEEIWKRQRRARGTSCEQSSDLPYDRRLVKKLYWWWALTQGDTSEFVPLEKLEAIKKDKALDAKIHNTGVEARDSSATESKRIQFLPDAEYLNSCTTRYVDPDKTDQYRQRTTYPRSERAPAFRARLAEVKRGHRMFRTTNNYLGLGPISSDTRDELWILRGARMPFVLRRRDDGQYQLIGEAYVHGIMHGEAVQGNFKPKPLVLV